MKKLFVLPAFLIFASFAQAAPITLTQIVMQKNSNAATGVYFTAGFNKELFCSSLRSSIQFGTYAAAKKAEGMADGIYICNGEFVHSQATPIIQAFTISDCGQPSDKIEDLCN